jgi:hypothetical protein
MHFALRKLALGAVARVAPRVPAGSQFVAECSPVPEITSCINEYVHSMFDGEALKCLVSNTGNPRKLTVSRKASTSKPIDAITPVCLLEHSPVPEAVSDINQFVHQFFNGQQQLDVFEEYAKPSCNGITRKQSGEFRDISDFLIALNKESFSPLSLANEIPERTVRHAAMC